MRLFIAENDGIECTIRDNDDQEDGCLPGLVAQAVTPLDAKIIVRAVNCHDDLLETLKNMLECLEEAHAYELDNDHQGDDPATCSYCRSIAEARAAIAKATGV